MFELERERKNERGKCKNFYKAKSSLIGHERTLMEFLAAEGNWSFHHLLYSIFSLHFANKVRIVVGA